MSVRSVKAGEAFIKVALQGANEVQKGLRTVERRLKNMAAVAANVGKRLVGIGAGVLGSLGAATVVFARAGDQLDKMSIRTGISVESLSELGFAAKRSGTDIETMANALQRMNRRLGRIRAGQAGSSEVAALEALGLSAEELSRMNPEETLLALADAMATMEDKTAAAGLAQRAFGTQVDKLLPLLLEGADGIRAMMEEGQRAGATMSEEDATAAALFTNALGDLTGQIKRVVVGIGGALSPVLTKFAARLTPIIASIIEWIDANRGLVVKIAAAAAVVTAAGAALLGFSAAITLATFAVSGLATVVGVLGSVLAAVFSPVGLAVAAVLAGLVVQGGLVVGAWMAIEKATGLVSKNFNALKAAAEPVLRPLREIARVVKQDIITAFGGIKDALAAGEFKLAAKILFQTLSLEFERGKLALLKIWVDLKNQILGVPVLRLVVRTMQAQVEFLKAVFNGLRIAVSAVFTALQQQWERFVASVEKGGGLVVKLAKLTPQFQTANFAVNALSSEPRETIDADREQLRLLEESVANKEKMVQLSAEETKLARLRNREMQRGVAQQRQSGAGGGAIEEAAQNEDSLARQREQIEDRIHRLRIARIEDQHQREIALLNLRYAREVDAAREAGRDITGIVTAFNLEIENLELERQRRVQEQQQRRREEQARTAQQIADETARTAQHIADETARLQIEATTPQGLDRELKLLQLERKQSLRDADPSNRAAIERQFDLREQIARQRAGGVDSVLPTGGQAQGTFSAAQAGAFGRGGVVENLLRENIDVAKRQEKELQELNRKQGATA